MQNIWKNQWQVKPLVFVLVRGKKTRISKLLLVGPNSMKSHIVTVSLADYSYTTHGFEQHLLCPWGPPSADWFFPIKLQWNLTLFQIVFNILVIYNSLWNLSFKLANLKFQVLNQTSLIFNLPSQAVNSNVYRIQLVYQSMP